MSKRRSPDDRKRLDPEDVLAGRVKLGAVELLDLIHRVNPTGRELHGREEALRYAQKSRLQSLLVRRFGAELSVAPDPENEGTVSLLHRGHGRDGCHAVLDALDEDARAWVRLQLDLGPPEEEAPRAAPAARPSGRGLHPPEESPEQEDASPESLVRDAEEAVASYDYERAQAQLTRALLASEGAPGPAAALLALLVDTLGDDAGALAVLPSLSRAALADPDVRALLALAEARAGDAEQALSLLRGAREAKGAEALAVLGAAAVARGDAEGAAVHLAEIRRRDPAHPAVAGLTDEIARLRAADRGPAEAEVAALVAAGQVEDAERRAAEVLGRWPESEAARRVIRSGEERRRRALEAAEREAREREAARAAARLAEQVDRVRRLLAEADPREGLGAWLELDPSLRRQAEPKAVAELLRWLDQTPARLVPRVRVEAVLALATARGALPADPEGALDALAPHEAALEHVAEARRVAHQAQAAIQARRVAEARAEVAAARRDLAGGDAKSALGRLSSPALRDLDESGRAEAEALHAEAAKIVAQEKRVADVGRLRAAGQRFEARALAEALRDEAEGEERARWEEERRVLQEEIQRDLQVTVFREPRPFGDEVPPRGEADMMESPVWVTEDGRTLVLARGQDRWVWLQLVDLPSRTIQAEALLRAPEPLANVYLHVLGRTAWVMAQHGALMGIDLDRFEVKTFLPARDLVPIGRHTAQATMVQDAGAPNGRYCWLFPADNEGFGGVGLVYDLQQRKVVRQIPTPYRLASFPGAREPRVGIFRMGSPGSLTLYEPRGVPVPGGRVELGHNLGPLIAAVHPSGEGLVVLTTASQRGHALVHVPPHGRARAPWFVEGTAGGIIMDLVSSRESGTLVLVFLMEETFQWEVIVVRPAGDAFELVHRSPVPRYSKLTRDATGRHVAVFNDDPPRAALVGVAPLDAGPIEPPPEPWVGHVMGAPDCLGLSGHRRQKYEEIRGALKDQTQSMLLLLARHQAHDVPALIERARALVNENGFLDQEGRRLRAWLSEQHPDLPSVRLLQADEQAKLGQWEEVREVLAPCTAAAFAGAEDEAQHLLHLRAVASLHLGDVEAAHRHLAEAGEQQGFCDLKGLHELLLPRPVPDPPPSGPDAPPLLSQLVWAIQDADAHLAAGAPERALAALSPRRFPTKSEIQVLARQAEAWLGVAAPAGQRITKIMSLASFLEIHRTPNRMEHEMPVPGRMWGREKLAELARRAAAWLESEGG